MVTRLRNHWSKKKKVCHSVFHPSPKSTWIKIKKVIWFPNCIFTFSPAHRWQERDSAVTSRRCTMCRTLTCVCWHPPGTTWPYTTCTTAKESAAQKWRLKWWGSGCPLSQEEKAGRSEDRGETCNIYELVHKTLLTLLIGFHSTIHSWLKEYIYESGRLETCAGVDRLEEETVCAVNTLN